MNPHPIKHNMENVSLIPDYQNNDAANARLIAAAPDLLEALQGFHPSQIKSTGELVRAWEKAQAAIHKATQP